MGIEVNVPTLNSIARTLSSGGDDVNGLAANAPTAVDAGDATGLITSMIVDVTENAATIVEGLQNAATAVRTAHDSYDETENVVTQQMTRHRAGLNPGMM